jgi:hypothetical protein
LEDVLWPKMIWPVTCPLKKLSYFTANKENTNPKLSFESAYNEASKLFENSLETTFFMLKK